MDYPEKTIRFEIRLGPGHDPYPYRRTAVSTGDVSTRLDQEAMFDLLEAEMQIAVKSIIEFWRREHAAE